MAGRGRKWFAQGGAGDVRIQIVRVVIEIPSCSMIPSCATLESTINKSNFILEV